jgi:hypothetical protein
VKNSTERLLEREAAKKPANEKVEAKDLRLINQNFHPTMATNVHNKFNTTITANQSDRTYINMTGNNFSPQSRQASSRTTCIFIAGRL